MQVKEKINVSGKMKALEIGESFSINRMEYKTSSVRTTANVLKQDSGLIFSVSTGKIEITVRRIS